MSGTCLARNCLYHRPGDLASRYQTGIPWHLKPMLILYILCDMLLASCTHMHESLSALFVPTCFPSMTAFRHAGLANKVSRLCSALGVMKMDDNTINPCHVTTRSARHLRVHSGSCSVTRRALNTTFQHELISGYCKIGN
jgi:hypothetical protein